MKFSLYPQYVLANWWNFTKLAWSYHEDKLKSRLALVTLTLFSSSQEDFNMSNFYCTYNIS